MIELKGIYALFAIAWREYHKLTLDSAWLHIAHANGEGLDQGHGSCVPDPGTTKVIRRRASKSPHHETHWCHS